MVCFLMKILTCHQWFSIHNLWTHVRWKEELLSQIIFLPRDERFFCKCLTLNISKINSFLDLTRKKESWEPFDITVSYGSRNFGIYMFPQLWNSFSEELIQQNRIIYINVMEDLFVKKKKWYKIINITIVESTENVYHATK